MRAVRFLVAAGVAACAVSCLTGGARGATVQRTYRLVRAGDDKGKQHPPGPYLTGDKTCTPDVPPEILALLPPNSRTTTEILGPKFDPAAFDEISVAGDGKMLALATSVSEAGVPGLTKQIVLLPEGPNAASIRIPMAAASDDQPSVQLDAFGYRCVFRSSAGPGGTSNIQIYSFTDDPLPAKTETLAVTTGTTESSFDPAFTARVRSRGVGGGISVRERDARVAFVSTDDLETGKNPDNLEQLFLWEEQGKVFRQLTRHSDSAAHVSRPSISKSGDIVDFECSADLLPTAVDPLDGSRVGNPDHVRQIFRWRRGRGLQQLTWSDGDCFSPRMEVNGRFVLFASRGDPITGGNPEKNLEIFEWVANAKPALRLRQLTQTAEGDSVFPRPTLNPQMFTFFSTAHPPVPPDPSKPAGPGNERPKFGEGPRECTPQALLYDHGNVVHIHGFLDVENAPRAIATPQKVPVLTGPPVPGIYVLKIYFATNDYHLNAKPAAGQPADDSASLFAFYVAMATRYAR
jgi:hypothetical protein